MAVGASTQYEIRSAGSDTLNGGGFVPGSANFITNWAIATATTTPVVTSASYSFVAGDVGAKFFLQAGANSIPGWYTIASVNAGAATLTATIGSAIKYDATIQCNGLNTAVGCGTSASLTSQTGGIDYSQQTSVQFNLSGVTTAAANAILLTASAANSMLGSILQITSGTNFTTGLYEVIAISVGVSITVDRNATSAAGALGVVKIGGALATLNKVGGSMPAGSTTWVSGSFTLTTTDTVSSSGTIGVPIFIKGYGTNRGDGYLGRTSNVKGLITTNMPALAYNSTSRLNVSGSFVQVETLNCTGLVSNSLIGLATDCVIKSCRAINASTNAAAVAISYGAGLRVLMVDCDIQLTGASGGSAAIIGTGAGPSIIGCHIVGGPAVGVNIQGTARVINNLITGCAGFGVSISLSSSSTVVSGNTIAGGSSDGINVVTGTAGIQHIYGNCITDNAGFGINMVSTSNSAVIAYNFFRNNTSGNVGNVSQWSATSLAQDGNVQAANGSAYVDYTDQTNGDYTLASTSPAVGVNQPYAASMGCFQRASGGAGGSILGC